MSFIKAKVITMKNKLNSLKTIESKTLDYEYIECPEYKKDNVPPSLTENWKKAPENYTFGGVDTHYWLHIKIPAIGKRDGQEPRLCVRTGREGQWDARNPQFIVYVNGKTEQAFDVNHTWMPLEYDKDYDIYLYLYSGLVGGTYLSVLSLEFIDLETEALFYDINVPYTCLSKLDESSYEYSQILNYLDKALLNLDLRDFYSEEYYKGVQNARKYLEEEFYGKICGNSNGVVSCIGHTHIDVAWRWTVAQTKEKAQRSFATAIKMMKRYPDYKFMSSQPQLYSFVKKEDPELYKEIKQAVKEGRWEAEGAMWLEPDVNLASGESLIRQMIYGKRFMKEEFGVDNKILWLPDVFGYTGALPQIMRKCNVTQFFTTKMTWNESNQMPNDMFIWEGIDGSQVFSAFEHQYSTEITPNYVYDYWKKFKNKSYNDEILLTFGFADGGGGPTYEMMENYKRFKRGIPGMPKTVIKTAGEYFDKAEESFKKSCEELKNTPKWVGEMYLEMHRGTYTSMARNKKFNRKSENLYMSLENIGVNDMLLLGNAYPEQEIRENMETILLNQFHDILPGSSIKEVYDVTDSEYAKIITDGERLLDNGLLHIKNNLNTKGGIFVYNPSPYNVSSFVTVDGTEYYAENVPARGWKVIDAVKSESNTVVTENSIENGILKITFDKNYNIISIYDKENDREVVSSGESANQLRIYEDYPREYDAWEITDYYKQKFWNIDDVSNVEIIKDGLRITRKYKKSLITQDIVLKGDSRRVDFNTTIDWNEDHVLLKTLFPVDVRNTDATYDIQFGHITRPTHRNNTWDAAKFEVSAHKWADLSEGNYGVSLLNDCKYGYSVEDNVMTLSLLKAATDPNPTADREVHTFTYSIYPHGGDFRSGGTVKEGYKLNMPLVASKVDANDGTISDNMTLVDCENENIVIETIKKAEDDGSVVVRMYDAYNQRGKASIKANFQFREVWICDMLENNLEQLKSKDGIIKVPVSNFEIVTLKFVI